MTAMTPEIIEAAWWNEQQGGAIGAVLGCVVGGVGGGLIGGIAVPLSIHRYRSRTLAFGFMGGFALTGLVMLAIGLYALLDGQPYHVWYGLLLTGGLLDLLGVWFIVMLVFQFRQMETRQVASDLIRGEAPGGASRAMNTPVTAAISAGVAALLLGLCALGIALFTEVF
jgi:hypothetical protein